MGWPNRLIGQSAGYSDPFTLGESRRVNPQAGSLHFQICQTSQSNSFGYIQWILWLFDKDSAAELPDSPLVQEKKQAPYIEDIWRY